MAGIYFSKCEPQNGRRDFHLGDKPLAEIIRRFGVRPENREPIIAIHCEPNEPLLVVVSVREEEAEGTEFQAGYYPAPIAPYHAMRHCGVGLSHIVGDLGRANLEPEPH